MIYKYDELMKITFVGWRLALIFTIPGNLCEVQNLAPVCKPSKSQQGHS
jgi:hypothetical protein